MSKIQLKNLVREMRDFEIPVGCDPCGGQTMFVASVRRPRTTATPAAARAGVVAVPDISLTAAKRTFPRTLTLAAAGTEGDTSEPEDEAILRAPKIDEAVQRRRLAVIRLPDPPAGSVDKSPAPGSAEEA